jgi:hypothetical protein
MIREESALLNDRCGKKSGLLDRKNAGINRSKKLPAKTAYLAGPVCGIAGVLLAVY